MAIKFSHHFFRRAIASLCLSVFMVLPALADNTYEKVDVKPGINQLPGNDGVTMLLSTLHEIENNYSYREYEFFNKTSDGDLQIDGINMGDGIPLRDFIGRGLNEECPDGFFLYQKNKNKINYFPILVKNYNNKDNSYSVIYIFHLEENHDAGFTPYLFERIKKIKMPSTLCDGNAQEKIAFQHLKDEVR